MSGRAGRQTQYGQSHPGRHCDALDLPVSWVQVFSSHSRKLPTISTGANCHKAPSGLPRLGDLPDVRTLKVDLDTRRLSAFGLTTGDVNKTRATAWGGGYVNHFIDKGRIKRVYTCRRLLCSHFTTLHRTLIGLMPLAAMEDAPPWLLSGGSPGARI